MSGVSNHPGIKRIRSASVHLGLSLLMLTTAPAAMPEGYDQIRHWISELAADGTSNAWLVKTGFLWLAYAMWQVADAMEWAWPGYERKLARMVGMLLIPIAAFDHQPWVTTTNADPMQSYLHYGFATLYFAGLAALIAGRVWRAPARPRWQAVFDYATLCLSVAVPVHMVTFNHMAGLLQRMGLTVIFAWVGLELWNAYRSYNARWKRYPEVPSIR